MKTGKIAAIMMVLITAMLYGCGRAGTNQRSAQLNEQRDMVVENSVQFVGLSQTYPVDTDMVNVEIINSTDSNIHADAYYTIERYTGSGWEQIPLELAFIDIAYVIPPGQKREFSIGLYHEMYDYKPGKYAVKKSVSQSGESSYMSVGFVLE